MNKSIIAVLGLLTLTSCVESYKYNDVTYEFMKGKNQINTVENSQTIYYDYAPFGSLDGIGNIMAGGRGCGFAGGFISDTNSVYFKNAAKKYDQIIFPMMMNKKLLNEK
ncbi:MAG: hypothetical protein ACP5N2_03405 [Candidatus Nanoarchaeia archaeon]